jgi:F-type H+-transporting ATPase subunit a
LKLVIAVTKNYYSKMATMVRERKAGLITMSFVVLQALRSGDAIAAGGPGLLLVFGVAFKSRLEKSGYDPMPAEKFSLSVFTEWILVFLDNLATDILPTKNDVKKFFPLLVAIFMFIYASNISGLVPGFPPATESMNTNLAMGLCVFLTYNYFGLKENGMKYLVHFLGPVWWLAPLILAIELVSHAVRPFSLSLRLYGNIYADHLVFSIVTGLLPIIAPSFFLFFGLLVATVQSFVFTLLSSIYISLAVSHDH